MSRLRLNLDYLYWIITILLLVIFFWVFLILPPPTKLFENKVKLSLEINPELIDIGRNVKDPLITINLKVDNPTSVAYPSDKYFYRVVINRSYPDSPGYIIKEFSKNLEPNGNFEYLFVWKKEYLPDNEEFKFRVNFNFYKRNKKDDIPVLISTSTKILSFKKIT